MSDRVRVIHGDCIVEMQKLIDAGEQYDSVVCDPPYHLTSIVKRFGGENAAPAQEGTDGAYRRASRGFMGKQWDGGDVAFRPETWSLCLQLLKPGGYLLAFSGTRTYHRMAVAIEDAGFEVRDMISWLYGSGFPKSHDVSKGIDRAADYIIRAQVRRAAVSAVEAAGMTLPGNSRHDWTVGEHAPGDKWWSEFQNWIPALSDQDRQKIEGDIVATIKKTAGWFTRGDIYDVRAPASDAAREWQGWGSALKPACEPICMARKPLDGTVAGNVLKHGTGAINIEASRIGSGGGGDREGEDSADMRYTERGSTNFAPLPGPRGGDAKGRWPANVIHDGSDEVVEAFPYTASGGAPTTGVRNGDIYGDFAERSLTNHGTSEGSAARFFYSAKADAADRCGSKHPTVKPVDLMAYLLRLVTRPGGRTLDPFAGSGSTGMAAIREGFEATLIEREAEYVADIHARIAHVAGEDTPLFTFEN